MSLKKVYSREYTAYRKLRPCLL